MEQLETLCTPEGVPLQPNTVAEIRRDIVRLRLAMEQIKEIEAARLERLEQAPGKLPHAMMLPASKASRLRTCWSTRFYRASFETDGLWRYAGLTGAPDESGSCRREKGLARTGNARVRCGMIQLAWRFLMFQKDSALAQWYRARTANARSGTRKTMIVTLARKLLIALWRLATTGEVPQGVVFRQA
jgi:transposase